MNAEHLGDALDHWKGAIIRQLHTNDWLQEFAVEPMISDQQPWDPQNIRVYRRLLGLHDNEPVFHTNAVFRHQTREAYFAELTHRGDLFLDPDTGIATGAADDAHITLEDIHSLFRGDYVIDRCLVVFQPAARGFFSLRIKEITERVIAAENNLDRDLYCCSYKCGRVAMLFFSVNRGRLLKLPGIFDGFIGSGGSSKIRIWPP